MASTNPLANTTAPAQLQFDINNPNVLVLFSSNLNSNRQSDQFKFFERSGLVGQGNLSGKFSSAIGTTQLQNAGEATMYLSLHKTGEPVVGEYKPLQQKAATRERLPETIKVCHIVMDEGEEVGAALTSSMLQAPVYFDIIKVIGDWTKALDTELLMIYLGGMRGINDGYEAYSDYTAQAEIDFGDFTTSSADDYYTKLQGHLNPGASGYQKPNQAKQNELANENLPESLKEMDNYNPITQPHRMRHLAAWQTKDEMLNHSAINYNTAATGSIDIVKFCSNLKTWSVKRTRARDGIGFETANINVPTTLKDNDSVKTLPNQLVMVVTEDVANKIRASQKWQEHQGNLIQALGLNTGLTNGYLGMFSNVVLIENDLLPRFKVKGVSSKTFTRGFIFGRETALVARNTFRIPMKFRALRKEIGDIASSIANVNYTLWVDGMNRGTNSEVLASTTYGIRVIRYPRPGTKAKSGETGYQTRQRYDKSERIDKGRVPVDWLDSTGDYA